MPESLFPVAALVVVLSGLAESEHAPTCASVVAQTSIESAWDQTLVLANLRARAAKKELECIARRGPTEASNLAHTILGTWDKRQRTYTSETPIPVDIPRLDQVEVSRLPELTEYLFIVRVAVDATGRVTAVEILRGPGAGELAKLVTEAAQKARFAPAKSLTQFANSSSVLTYRSHAR